jgi:hypothetical protein
MSDQSGIPAAMQWEIKRIKVLQKETISMTPNKTQDVKPGQTIIVDLPYNSKCDLGSFSWFYDGSTAHNGSPNGYADYVQTRFFPRNSASVIQKFPRKGASNYSPCSVFAFCFGGSLPRPSQTWHVVFFEVVLATHS